MMYSILIVDYSIYKDSICKIFTDENYSVTLCESAYDAMKKLKAIDFDLIVSEVELPGDNAFDLYNYIRTNYPYIPAIMTTDKNIDTFFDAIFKEGIGNILCKPFKKEEVLNLAQKLITHKNIFGLHNYIRDIKNQKKIRITRSKQIRKAVAVIADECIKTGFPPENRMSLELVLNELTINAIYHSHGFTKEKEKRQPVTLPEGGYVDLFFAPSDEKFGIAIDDYRGELSKEVILQSIYKVVQETTLIEQAVKNGDDISAYISETGRGIDLVRRLTGEYYFIIEKGKRTEIILILDKAFFDDDSAQFSSIKIIEDLPER